MFVRGLEVYIDFLFKFLTAYLEQVAFLQTVEVLFHLLVFLLLDLFAHRFNTNGSYFIVAFLEDLIS